MRMRKKSEKMYYVMSYKKCFMLGNFKVWLFEDAIPFPVSLSHKGENRLLWCMMMDSMLVLVVSYVSA